MLSISNLSYFSDSVQSLLRPPQNNYPAQGTFRPQDLPGSPSSSGVLDVPILRLPESLARALMGLWIFYHLRGSVERPSTVAPGGRHRKWKKVFESSSRTITKVLQHFFFKENIEVTKSHQGSNLATCHIKFLGNVSQSQKLLLIGSH